MREKEIVRITRDDGLLSNRINYIYKDHKGFVWFAHNNGLQRYDGKRMVSFLHDPADSASLPDNYVITLLEDNQKRLWVGTAKGPCIYDPLHLHFKSIPVETPKPQDIFVINSFHQDSKGNIWMVLYSRGLFLLDSTKGVFKSYTQSWPKCFANIFHITEDKLTGNYWLGTDSGLIMYDNSRREYYSYNHNPLGLPCFRGDYFKGGIPEYNLNANNILRAIIWKPNSSMHI